MAWMIKPLNSASSSTATTAAEDTFNCVAIYYESSDRRQLSRKTESSSSFTKGRGKGGCLQYRLDITEGE